MESLPEKFVLVLADARRGSPPELNNAELRIDARTVDEPWSGGNKIKRMTDHEGFKKAPPAVPTDFRKKRLELISYYIRRV